MSANKLDVKSLIEGNLRSKEIADRIKSRNLYQSLDDLSDDEAEEVGMLKEQIEAMENECKNLEEYIGSQIKEGEDADRQAEAYKKALQDAQELAKQQYEQIQAAKAVAEVSAKAEADARIAAERLAAQQAAAALAAQQAAALAAQQAAALRAQQTGALVAQQTAMSPRSRILEILRSGNLH